MLSTVIVVDCFLALSVRCTGYIFSDQWCVYYRIYLSAYALCDGCFDASCFFHLSESENHASL